MDEVFTLGPHLLHDLLPRLQVEVTTVPVTHTKPQYLVQLFWLDIGRVAWFKGGNMLSSVQVQIPHLPTSIVQRFGMSRSNGEYLGMVLKNKSPTTNLLQVTRLNMSCNSKCGFTFSSRIIPIVFILLYTLVCFCYNLIYYLSI